MNGFRWWRHVISTKPRNWFWHPRGWVCSHCGYIIRADKRDPAWRAIAERMTVQAELEPKDDFGGAA